MNSIIISPFLQGQRPGFTFTVMGECKSSTWTFWKSGHVPKIILFVHIQRKKSKRKLYVQSEYSLEWLYLNTFIWDFNFRLKKLMYVYSFY